MHGEITVKRCLHAQAGRGAIGSDRLYRMGDCFRIGTAALLCGNSIGADTHARVANVSECGTRAWPLPFVPSHDRH